MTIVLNFSLTLVHLLKYKYHRFVLNMFSKINKVIFMNYSHFDDSLTLFTTISLPLSPSLFFYPLYAIPLSFFLPPVSYFSSLLFHSSLSISFLCISDSQSLCHSHAVPLLLILFLSVYLFLSLTSPVINLVILLKSYATLCPTLSCEKLVY